VHQQQRLPPAPPPAPAATRLWLDVSNYQGTLEPAWFEQWGAQGFGGLIVQAVTGSDGRCYTEQQLDAALAAGWRVAGYLWCSPGDANNSSTPESRLSLFEPFLDLLDFIALDVEESGTSVADVDADLARCDALVGDSPIYTGKWCFDAAGWSATDRWATRRLWVSIYDGIADVDAGFVPFGGWSEAWMKQYTSTPLDLDVMRV
jgi:hypothetical protein